MDPTEASPIANSETEVVAEEPLAWSESDEPSMRPYRRFMSEVGKYLLPAVVPLAAMVATLIMGHQPAPVITPAPVTTVITTPAAAPVSFTPMEDDRFILMLQGIGWAGPDRERTISAGHWVCSSLEAGHTPEQIVQGWDGQPKWDPGAPAQEHADDVQWVNTAIRAYCPQLGVTANG